MALAKTTVRQQLLSQRQDLSDFLYQQLSQKICQYLDDFLGKHLAADKTVLGYYPYRQEPDLSVLLRHRKYQWGLPRCLPPQHGSQGSDRQLAWHRWQWGEPLVTNRYGIQEPAASLPLIDVTEVGVLIIPAVAIDQRGYRLGYGGGYFDRLLSQQPWQQVITIGVVFDFAHVPTLPIDKWDQPLNAICTESGLVSF
jgi:5-formyltetrahydrofolate cyclo-ligase